MKNTLKNCLKLVTLSAAVAVVMPLSAKPFGHHSCSPAGDPSGNANGYELGQRNCGKGGKHGFGLFDRIDANDDGQLSLEEVTDARFKRAIKHFLRLDANQDGSISLEEFLAKGEQRRDRVEQFGDALIECVEEKLGETLPERPEPASEEERFAELDTNASGILEPEELVALLNERIANHFAENDTNSDGFLSQEEFEAAAEGRLERRKAFKECVAELSEGEDILDELSGADIKTVAE